MAVVRCHLLGVLPICARDDAQCSAAPWRCSGASAAAAGTSRCTAGTGGRTTTPALSLPPSSSAWHLHRVTTLAPDEHATGLLRQIWLPREWIYAPSTGPLRLRAAGAMLLRMASTAGPRSLAMGFLTEQASLLLCIWGCAATSSVQPPALSPRLGGAWAPRCWATLPLLAFIAGSSTPGHNFPRPSSIAWLSELHCHCRLQSPNPALRTPTHAHHGRMGLESPWDVYILVVGLGDCRQKPCDVQCSRALLTPWRHRDSDSLTLLPS
ncbi:hypothetical protein BS78_09G239800 [Paspalum vaginatum]|nr:hypothetical protein BS78_09G239800 [Paspalum vaginatum]